MTVNFYEGRLGREHLIYSTDKLPFDFLPRKKELITVPNPKYGEINEVYQVINVLYDYFPTDYGDEHAEPEIDYFLELYDWE